MSKGRVQAKHISTPMFLLAMEATAKEWGPSMIWDIVALMALPKRVVLAKAQRLINQGVIDGCACGCRGDFIPLAIPDGDVIDVPSRAIIGRIGATDEKALE